MYSINRNKDSREDLISWSLTSSSSKNTTPNSKKKTLRQPNKNSVSLNSHDDKDDTSSEYDSESSQSESDSTKTTTSSIGIQTEQEEPQGNGNNSKLQSQNQIIKNKRTGLKKNKTKSKKSENLFSLVITNFNTSALKFDKKILNPRIRITLFDPNNGKILKKEDNQTNDYSCLTNPGCLIDSHSFSFEWPNDTIIFDEEIDYLNTKNTFVMILELVDNSNTKSLDKWHRIGWSFLRLNSEVIYMKENKISLQLFKYTKSWRNKKKNLTFKQWSMKTKRKLYKGFLNLNLNNKEFCIEPKSELTKAETSLHEQQSAELSSDVNWRSILNKLQTKVFQNPEKIICKLRMDKGSTICVFSPDSVLLAYTECFRNSASINIFDILTLKKTLELQGHESTIHSIEWLKKLGNDDNILISSSEDQTCIMWNIKQYSYNILYVLYHPTFVYCATFTLSNISVFDGVATGCRDGILRIWKKNYKNDEDTLLLHQELKEHKTFIIGVIFNPRNKRLYSGEKSGELCEWIKQGKNNEWSLKKKLLKNVKSLKQFILCTKLNRIYILTQTNLSSYDLKTNLQHEYLNDICPNDFAIKIALSPCANWIFMGFHNKVICWNSRTKSITNNFDNFSGNVTSIDFNIEQNMLSISTISKNYGSPGGGLYVYASKDYFSINRIADNYTESNNRTTKISGNNYFNSFLVKLDNLFDFDVEQNSYKTDKYMKMDKNIYEEYQDENDSNKTIDMGGERLDSTDSSINNKTFSIGSNRTFTLSNKNCKTFDIINNNNNKQEQNTFTITNERNNDSDATDISEDLD